MTDIAHRWADSYRTRLTIGYVVVIALIASAWAWSLFGPLNNAIVSQQSDNLQAVAQAGALVLGQTETTAAETAMRLTARTNLRMTIIAPDGSVLADSEEVPSTMENHRDRPEVAEALGGNVGVDRRVSTTQGTERIYVAVPASFDGQNVALRVSDSLERINSVAASARRFGLVLLALALAFAAAIVARLTAVASQPVARLSRAANAMAQGNLSAVVPEESGDLGVLSSALVELREQMRARLDALEAEQGNLRAVLDGLPDGVVLLHDGEVRIANSAIASILKTDTRSWRGHPVSRLGLPASIAGAIERGLGSAEPLTEDCGPDTSGHYFRVGILPLNPAEEHTRHLVVISDVTERVRIDSVRRDFVANASHELKTPAAGISLLAESATNAATDGDIDQAITFAKQISSESARLGRLVSDLLDLSRLEGKTVPGSVVDVRKSIENTMLGHRIAAGARGIELSVDLESVAGTDVIAAADPTDLAVALDNLLDNAIKYTESGSVLVNVNINEQDVCISVADTGIGIPGADIPRIFERFYRVDRARSRDSGGTGLGLALVRHVVERSNGTIEVISTPGKGSVFTITLPRARH